MEEDKKKVSKPHFDMAEADQSLTYISSTYPTSLRVFYRGCVEEGFTAEISFVLTRDLLSHLCGIGRRKKDQDQE